jgi:hypothetical protein
MMESIVVKGCQECPMGFSSSASLLLAGEAQKIDRIINCFGKHFYAVNKVPFTALRIAWVTCIASY